MMTDSNFNSLITIDLLKAGALYLESCGIPDSRAEADLLLSFVRGISRDKLYLESDENIAVQERESFIQLLQKRGTREPLAYLLKTREFMGLAFYVDHNVLIPRPETELLVEEALKAVRNHYNNRAVRILDLCTGSGILAISLAYYYPQAFVLAGDISAGALGIATRNAQKHQVAVDFRQGDLFQPFRGETFDMIVSNPPYVTFDEYLECSPEVKKEPSIALLGGDDGLDFYRRITQEADPYLKPQGMIMLEIGCSQGTAVAGLLATKGYETAILPDYAGLDRIVIAKKE